MRKNTQLINIYEESGYCDVPSWINSQYNFIFSTGGRGTGKTYGALQYVIKNNIKFIYLRRTQTEIDEIFTPMLSPFKSLNEDHGWSINPFKLTKTVSYFSKSHTDDKNVIKPTGKPLGYLMALSVIANIRGFDASDVDLMIYDEFIPETHKKRMRGEAEALLNAYETINRNRELKGLKPLKLLCLSNANELANPIYIYLKIVNKVWKMREIGQEIYADNSRGLCVITLDKSEISAKKADTALYRLTKGTAFFDMAIENKFKDVSSSTIKSMPLKEYIPFLVIGELCFYEHKSRAEIYVSEHVSGVVKTYGTSKSDRLMIKKVYNWLWIAYLNQYFIFENLMLEVLFLDYFTETC